MKILKTKIDKILYFVQNPGLIIKLLKWPELSLTSYMMVSDLYKQGIHPKTVLDVGANVGQFSVAVKEVFEDVMLYSFEPLQDCFKVLQKNLEKYDDSICINDALGSEIGEKEFRVNSKRHSSSFLELEERHKNAFPDAMECNVLPVNLNTLNNVFSDKSLKAPVLMKLDVQGYEEMVIQGGSEILDKIDYIIMETSFNPLYKGEKTFIEMNEIMDKYGFVFLRPVGLLCDPESGEALQMDALYINKKCK